MKTPIIKYQRKCCEWCGQSITWASRLNKGMSDITLALAYAVKIKGQNAVHPAREMEVSPREYPHAAERIRAGKITPSQTRNLSHARFHGLIARLSGLSGFYCLTKKGASFLRGEPVALVAIIDKSKSANIGYLADPESKIYMTTIDEVHNNQGDYWQGWDYDASFIE